MKKKYWIILGVSFFIALFFFTKGAKFGLPHLIHPDEKWHMTEALRFGQHLNFGVDIRVKSPPTMLANFFIYATFYIYGRVTGRFNSLEDFKKEAVLNPTDFYYLGRLSSGFFFALTVIPLFFLIRKMLKNDFYATLGVAFYIFNPLVIRCAHWMKDDGTGTFTFVLALSFIYRLFEKQETKDYILSALFCALAASAKIYNQLLVVPVFVIWLMKDRSFSRGLIFVTTYYLFVLVFHPYILTSPGKNLPSIPFIKPAISALSRFIPSLYEKVRGAGMVAHIIGKERGFLALLYSLKAVNGLYFLILLTASLLISLGFSFRKKEIIPFTAFAIIHIGVLSVFPLVAPRYFLPSIPIFCILLTFSMSNIPLTRAIWLVFILPLTFKSSLYIYTLSTSKTTKEMAINYIKKHIPFHSRFLVEPGEFPTLPRDRESVWREFKDAKERLPTIRGTTYKIRMKYAPEGFKVWVIPSSVKYPAKGTPLEELRSALYTPQELKQKFDYILITGRIIKKFKDRPEPEAKVVWSFLKSIADNFGLEKRFCADKKKGVLGLCIYLFNTHLPPSDEEVFVKEKYDVAHY